MTPTLIEVFDVPGGDPIKYEADTKKNERLTYSELPNGIKVSIQTKSSRGAGKWDTTAVHSFPNCNYSIILEP